MYAILLTGTIASGKSTVGKLFAQHGITRIDADHIAKALTEPDTDSYHKIIAHFGEKVIDPSTAVLSRKKLRDIIFSDTSERLWLERLLHPLIREKIGEALAASTSPYSIVEIPLLFNREKYPFGKRVLLILAPEYIQVQRLLARDHIDAQQAQAILASQPDEQTRIKLADDIIMNDQDIKHLQTEVEELHQKYLLLSQSPG